MLSSRLSQRFVRGVDIVLVLWLVVCLLLGIAVSKRLNHLGALGDGVVNTGHAITATAGALDGLSNTPIIGGALHSIDSRISAMGNATIAQGNRAKVAIWHAALLAGALVTLLPTLPLILLWLLVRIGWERERAGVRQALVAGEPGVHEYLAHRTIEILPFRELRKISTDPWGDIREGRLDVLAGVELERLGLTSAAAKASTSAG